MDSRSREERKSGTAAAGVVAFSRLLVLHVPTSLLSVDYSLLIGGVPAMAVAGVLDLDASGIGHVVPGRARAAFLIFNWVRIAEALLFLLLAVHVGKRKTGRSIR
jgi:hypothetical protein